MPNSAKNDVRISMRIGEHLISFRLSKSNLEDVDRMARYQGIARSEWIRNAIHAQLVQELIAEEAPELLDEPEVEPEPEVAAPVEPPPVAPLPVTPEDLRANRWA
jgi:hypothetical protein